MFNKLREKLKNWTLKVAEESEKKEEIQEESKKVKEQEKTKKITEKAPEVIEKPTENSKRKQKEPKEDVEEPENIIKEVEKKNFFQKITSKEITINEKDFEKYEEDLKFSLLENNVAFEVTNKIISELKNQLVGQQFNKKSIKSEIENKLKQTIETILIEPFDLISKIKEKKEPYIILFCGINGSGKTTTIAKIANLLKKNKISCVMAAADTFRAASIEQINKHGEKLGIKVISQTYGTDPASIGFEAIQYAKKNSIQAVLIDTAGRMHTSKNLLREIEKVERVCKPDTSIFIGESITGNDSVEQIKAFNEYLNLSAIILTKSDIDEKGGTALSLGYITKKPILYLGTGQNYEDIEQFDKNKFIERLGL